MKTKTFWQKPEGKVGAGFLIGGIALSAYLLYTFSFVVIPFLFSQLGTILSLAVIGLVIFLALDSRSRKLIGYMYQSMMRWITGIFIKIDPLSILKGYVQDMKYNFKKLNIQIGKLRSEKHQLMETIANNRDQIDSNMELASKAKQEQNQQVLILKSRKAGRLKESNLKLSDLLKKMEVIQRVLTKMRDNTSILIEDTEDQIQLKEQEYKAIMAGHSAMTSAMNIIKGDKDKKAMFDQAMDVITEDVSMKVGEMENFMDLSEDFMKSVDIQNGIFEEKGMKMLEEWESKSTSLLLGGSKDEILRDVAQDDILDISSQPVIEKEKLRNEYDDFFDE